MVLILGGTAEARALAARAARARACAVTSSLAGRVANPRLPEGEVRIGGFGGPEALARWLAEHARRRRRRRHPPVRRSASPPRRRGPRRPPACRSCASSVPAGRERPGDRWHWVDDLDEAAAAIEGCGERVLLTTGRQGLAAFAGVDDAWFLIRCVDPPGPPLPRPLRDRCSTAARTRSTGELALIDAPRAST